MIDLTGKITLARQLELLHECIKGKLDLSSQLELMGLDYDNLRYRDYPCISLSYARCTTLEDYDLGYHRVPVVSFFSGAGGLDIGFDYAGYQHLASIEINENFCGTLRRNRQNWRVIGPPNHSGDVSNRDELSTVLREEVGLRPPFPGVFHGGPPCQPFSIAANQRFMKKDKNFKRIGFSHAKYGNLLFDFIWFIQEFRPRVFLIENVTGLLRIDQGEQLSKAIQLLQTSGYTVTRPTILNTADYGVPQNRLRVFVCGTLSSRTFQFPRKDSLMVSCYEALDKPLDRVENHVTRDHKAASIIRYMELNYGERDALGRVDRLDPELPSKTVIAGGTKGGGRSHLHPFTPRTLSVRESARLQTFPDSFVFCGSPARQFTQVGNAVPPLLGLKLADAIYRQIYL